MKLLSFFRGTDFTPCEFEYLAGKSSSRNWKQSIRYGGKPLLNFIESYESPDGKKCCHFVSVGRRFASPDSSVVIPPSQQDDAIGRVSDSSLPVSTSDILSEDQSSINHPTDDQSIALPDFEPSASPVITWSSGDSDTFCHSLEAVYGEVVYWRSNCFKIPSGNFGKKFVLELARLFRSAGEGSSLESIALKATFTFCILVTHKPTHTSKSKDHISCLERKIVLWSDGNLNELLLEGRAIQCRLHTIGHSYKSDNIA